ncbi:D-alanyl-D-alanine carboxypeptidase [Lentzea atacamensis]|uniref:D-alanyl-D-alanine carboxypeptidase n=1 Tax=Lentzea atacamensis TaxID=531938 RepID=A0A316HK48_9PSEU|nr:serine hydrolase domain-containing protein [Lentzea atacamensis]PWK80859.1 D-alanyl-D-alanine carboxypeptidase [Lentzea atacamensis]
MRTRFTATVIAAALLVATAGPAVADTVDRAVVQQGLGEVVQAGLLGAQLRVTHDREHFTARSGKAELNTAKPVPLNGRFRAGSITKTFVATVVLQLAGESRVELDAPVDRYLPGLVDQRVTVRQLLQHTSGLYDHNDALPFDPAGFEQIRYKHWEPEELVALSTSRPLEFEPGTKREYSNTNYVVAGLLVEKITGRPLERVVEHRILKPLRLNDTLLPIDDDRIHGPHAHGYWAIDGKPVDITRFNPSVFWAEGNLVSTTKDLDTFFAALAGGRLLKHAQQRELTRTTAISPGYGLGVTVQVLPCGTTVWGHDGFVPGFGSLALTTPDTRKRAVLNVNTSAGEGDPSAGVEKILGEVFC